MNEALVEELIAAEEALVAALDGEGAPAIEASVARFRAALAAVQQVGDWQPSPELKQRLADALVMADAARIRTNLLADRTRRQIDRLSRAGARHRPAIAYGRNGRIRG